MSESEKLVKRVDAIADYLPQPSHKRTLREAAAALTAAEARIKMLSEALAEKQAAIDAAYPAMKRALRLGQIDVSKVEIADENPERRKLRLGVFRALDMPTACLSGHVSDAARQALTGASDAG